MSLTHAINRHARTVLIASGLVSLVGVYFASQLRLDADLSRLLPPTHPTVQALARLRAVVGSESDAAVVIRSPSFAANKAFAEALIPPTLDLRTATGEAYFQRVDYRRDTRFLKDNALYFATAAELHTLRTALQEFIRTASLRASPLYLPLDDPDERAADTLRTRLQRIYVTIVGGEYPVSPDSTVLVLRFHPTMAQTDITRIAAAYAALQGVVDALHPTRFHARMEVVLAGRLLRQLIEVRAITTDAYASLGSGVSAVILLVVSYFAAKGYHTRAQGRWAARILLRELARMPLTALLIGLPFLMSLAITFGLAYLVFGTLNLLTSTLGLVLFGLGIDYGIHFYARYIEERALGAAVPLALETTFTSTGRAIAISAMTTAAALYALMVGDFRGFSQFGCIAATGILLALAAMVVLMPALITVCETHGWLHQQPAPLVPAAPLHWHRFPLSRRFALLGCLTMLGAVYLLPRVRCEYDFTRLQPAYAEYKARRQLLRRVYPPSNGRNPAFLLADNPAEVEALKAALGARAAMDTISPTIGAVVALQDRFPMTADQQRRKLEQIHAVRRLLQHPLLADVDTPDLTRLRRAAATTHPIAVAQVPDFLKRPFVSRTGEVGDFLRVYPRVPMADGRQAIEFLHDVGTVTTASGHVYHAASTALVGAAMLELMRAEAPWMVLLAALMVTLLMGLHFRAWRWTAVALLPLLMGMVWMLLAMEALGLRLNFYNMVVLPAVLGIGNDAGAHIVHRYREEGPGSLPRVLRSTGEHITMGALTTAIGFSGLLLSFHPGLRSMGLLALVGIGTTWLAALLFLPAVLQWHEDHGYGQRLPSGSETETEA